MKFTLVASDIFSKQIAKLQSKSKSLLNEKLDLILENPFRYNKVHSKVASKVFRVRFSIQNKETRLIYAVIEPNIILVCLLDRKSDYADLEKYLKKAIF